MRNGHDYLSRLDGTNILVLSPTPTYPINQGNRKRIYSINQQLKDHGAKIHFLYYPQDWVCHVPTFDLKQEAQQWDSFHLIPTTRHPQTHSQGEDHTIDEWWDYAIGDYLKWLFCHYYFDAFIVNYTYLSKALEFAPPHVCRILDTHDQFSERRNLFESQGLGKEFFHTTKEEEAIALNRADLVWAIKEEEAVFFRELSDTPVITMLHTEPKHNITRQHISKDQDYLVLGMIGVNNTVNLQNVRNFIKAAFPLFHKDLAPIKLKLAGSMCEGLRDLETKAGIELLGRVESVTEFYQVIDVAIVPMHFSTGLKIKAVEALSTGLPIIAHEHAFEGIPSSHPYHECNSFSEIAERCIELAYNPSQLSELREATELSYEKMSAQVQSAMEETRLKLLKSRDFLVIVLNERFFQEGSPEYEATILSIYYFKHLVGLVLYVDTPLTRKQTDLLRWHDLIAKVIFSPQAADESNLKGLDSGNISYSILSLEEVCLRRKVVSIWFLGLPRELNNKLITKINSIPVYVRSDIIRAYNSAQKAEQILMKFSYFSNLTIVNSSIEAIYYEQQLIPHAKVNIVPFWRDLPARIWTNWKEVSFEERRVIMLATSTTLPLAHKIWTICGHISPSKFKPLVVLPQDELGCEPTDVLPHNWQDDLDFNKHLISVTDLMAGFTSWDKKPLFVIDLSDEHLAFAIYLETLRRSAIVIIKPDGGENVSQHCLIRGNNPVKLISISDLLNLLTNLTQDAEMLGNLETEEREAIGVMYGNDIGWAKIWQQVTRNKQAI